MVKDWTTVTKKSEKMHVNIPMETGTKGEDLHTACYCPPEFTTMKETDP